MRTCRSSIAHGECRYAGDKPDQCKAPDAPFYACHYHGYGSPQPEQPARPTQGNPMTMTATKANEKELERRHKATKDTDMILHALRRYIPEASFREAREHLACTLLDAGIELTNAAMRAQYEKMTLNMSGFNFLADAPQSSSGVPGDG